MLTEGVPAPTIEQASSQAGYPAPVLQLTDELNLELIGARSARRPRPRSRPRAATWEPHPARRGRRPHARRARPAGQARAAPASTSTRTASAPACGRACARRSRRSTTRARSRCKDLEERMLFVEAIETVKCLDEGVIESVADANIGSIMGIGFPGWTGGVLQYINGYDGGLAGFVARARELADDVRRALRRRPPRWSRRPSAARSTATSTALVRRPEALALEGTARVRSCGAPLHPRRGALRLPCSLCVLPTRRRRRSTWASRRQPEGVRPLGADVNAYFPGTITIRRGDKVRFLPVGFHSVDLPPRGQKPMALAVEHGAPIAGASDSNGVPYWFNGQPEPAVHAVAAAVQLRPHARATTAAAGPTPASPRQQAQAVHGAVHEDRHVHLLRQPPQRDEGQGRVSPREAACRPRRPTPRRSSATSEALKEREGLQTTSLPAGHHPARQRRAHSGVEIIAMFPQRHDGPGRHDSDVRDVALQPRRCTRRRPGPATRRRAGLVPRQHSRARSAARRRSTRQASTRPTRGRRRRR